MVQRLIFRHNLSQGRPIWTNNVQRNDGAEWTLHEAAARLGIIVPALIILNER